MEKLERDVAFEIVVPGAKDLAHAPGAEPAEEAAAAQDVTGRWKGVRRFRGRRGRPPRLPVDAPTLVHGAFERKR
jgi:hypothetical protein